MWWFTFGSCCLCKCGYCCVLQLALLSNLRTLDLSCSKYVTTSQGALVHLSRLRHLAPAQPGLPACLGELTQLEVLAIKDCTYADHHHALLKNALPNLQCLTCLLLRIDGNGLPRLPSELAQLGRLQRFLLSSLDDAPSALDYRLPPAGPWLASLRWLGLSWAIALENLDVLAAARRLEYLCLLTASGFNSSAAAAAADSERWPTFWRWAGTHPSLRCLGIELKWVSIESPAPTFLLSLLNGVLDLQHRRPALRVHRTEQGAAPDFWAEVLTLSDIPA